jgi:hypothetical protein
MYVDDPNLDLYTEKLDKTLIYYKDQLINREYLELPIFINTGTYFIGNDYSLMLNLIIHYYPFRDSPEIQDKLLKKHFKYKITQGMQQILQYIKDIQNDDFKKYFGIKPWNRLTKIRNPERYNLPCRDYFELAEYAHEVVGRCADIKFVQEFSRSFWLKKYTPNGYVDVIKLKAFAKKYDLEKYLVDETLEDPEWMNKHAHRYNPNSIS